MAHTTAWSITANEGDAAYAHELQGPEPANDVLRLSTPHYHLMLWVDRGLRMATAQLRILTVPAEGWRVLDEVSIYTHGVRDDEWQQLVVAKMRAHRRCRGAS